MLKIRLRRMGSKHDARYRVVVSDSRSTPRGRFVEVLGTYNPGEQPATAHIDVARMEDWIRKGAHPSGTVKRLLLDAQAKQAG